MSDDVSRVKEAINIVDVVGEFVDLKKTGKNYKGLCPFHKEKTPSFVVSEERGTYKCFGCGEYGDVFSFLMKRDNMTFPEALDYLAGKAGIVLDNTRANRKEKIHLEKYYKINEDAKNYFYQNLLTNKMARSYLRDREISDYTINEFALGYAKDSWDSLYNYMVRKGHKEKDLLYLGLIKKNQRGGYYDAYRNRLIFPIYNLRSRVVAFGGRTLGNDQAKYINSSDSRIYHKSRHLYGLNLIHGENDRDRIILVEGYMDVIGLRQNGLKNTVAALGTALTEDQAKLCNRYGKKIYLCYDSDSAGIKASLRAIEVFRSIGVYPKIISLGQGMDPDDFIKAYSNEAFESKIKEAANHIDYQIDLILEDFDPEEPGQIEDVLGRLGDVINPITSEIVKDEYIEKIAKILDINPMSLASDIKAVGERSRHRKVPTRIENQEEKKMLPVNMVLAMKFAVKSKAYYEKLDSYLKELETYNLGYIYDYIKETYQDKPSLDLGQMKEDLGLSDRQEEMLSFKGIINEEEAFEELSHRLERFYLEEEKRRLKDEISMLASLEDKNEDLSQKLRRLAEIEVELKSKRSWRG